MLLAKVAIYSEPIRARGIIVNEPSSQVQKGEGEEGMEKSAEGKSRRRLPTLPNPLSTPATQAVVINLI